MSESALEVRGLCKRYSDFALEDVGFSVGKGRITGLIGRNGAGKTTTLKCVLGLSKKDGGEVRFFGKPFEENAREIRRRIGVAGGAAAFYPHRKIGEILDVTRAFYDNWDDAALEKYMRVFKLNRDKTPAELSEGMKVKFSLTLALSHRAEILLLDEPTSGLDPVSRDELTEIFRFLRDEGAALLFSTHITTDLEKCADDLVYLANGHVLAAQSLQAFLAEKQREGLGNHLEDIMAQMEKVHAYEILQNAF